MNTHAHAVRHYGKSKKSRVKLRIPPTIYEVDEEDDSNYMENGGEDQDDKGKNTIVNLKILENDAEEVCRQRFALYGKSKKKYIDWDDSDSDSSAK